MLFHLQKYHEIFKKIKSKTQFSIKIRDQLYRSSIFDIIMAWIELAVIVVPYLEQPAYTIYSPVIKYVRNQLRFHF